MSNLQKSILIFVGILAAVALTYFVITDKRENYNWSETYTQNEKDPYDTYVISEMLKSYLPKEKFKTLNEPLSESLPENTDEPSSYVFIGNRLFLDSLNLETLLGYVEQGNHAFVSATELPEEFVLSLYTNDCDESDFFWSEEEAAEYDYYNYWSDFNSYRSNKANLQFSHPDLKAEEEYVFKHKYKNKDQNYNWRFIDNETFCQDALEYENLGRIGLDSMNFIRVPYGEGYFLIHTTPIVFTNYQMINENGLAYAGKVFSHLPEGDIYWDEKSKTYTFPESNTPRGFSQSPLQYILSQKSLRWSWYMGLALVFLYVLFRAKRRQRIIPILPENTNTSLEFIKTVGRLYYQQNEHKKLAQQEMKLFLYYLRDHYNIPTLKIDDTLVQKVAIKSEVPREEVKKIFQTWKKIEKSPSISEHTLIFFHNKVDNFYRNSK